MSARALPRTAIRMTGYPVGQVVAVALIALAWLPSWSWAGPVSPIGGVETPALAVSSDPVEPRIPGSEPWRSILDPDQSHQPRTGTAGGASEAVAPRDPSAGGDDPGPPTDETLAQLGVNLFATGPEPPNTIAPVATLFGTPPGMVGPTLVTVPEFAEVPLRAPIMPARPFEFLRLELAIVPDRWDPALPPDIPSFRLDTLLSQTDSQTVGDQWWSRTGFQSSRVDLMTGQRISIYSDLVYQVPFALTWDAPRAEAPQALGLEFKQTGQQWEYGVEYRSLDPRFQRFAGSVLKTDEAIVETSAAWRVGPIRIRGFALQTWNNLAEDAARDRTTKLLGGTGVDLTLPWNTWLFLSYAGGTAERSRDFLTAAQARRLTDSPRAANSAVETSSASLFHWAEKWDVSLSSSYTPSRNADNPSQQSLSLSQDLSATLRPTEKLGSTVALTLWQERQDSTGYQSDGRTASLYLWAGPFFGSHMVTLWGAYDRGSSLDRSWNAQSISASTTLSRHLGRTFLGDASVALDVGYNRYLDGVDSANSSGEVYGRIILKLIDF